MIRKSVLNAAVAVVSLAGALCAGEAEALVIDTQFANPGQRSFLVRQFDLPIPGRLLGGGDFVSIVETAARMWEAVLNDDRQFSITFGFSGRLPADTLAAALPGNDRSNEIVFNTRFDFFADPTPEANEEFGGFVETTADFGGGEIVSNRGFTTRVEPISGFDLLTIALHEIGHVLGNPFDSLDGAPSFSIANGLLAGTELPCFGQAGGGCEHLAIGGSLLDPGSGLNLFHRTLIGGADLLFVVHDGGFLNFDAGIVAPSTVPEPAPFALLAFGMLAFGFVRRRGRRATAIAL